MQNEKTKKTKWARKFVIPVIIGITLCTAMIIFAMTSQNNLRTLTVNNTEIAIEFATSSQEKSRGLCCRDTLPENQGMLFVYDRPGDYGFWMKDTRIPLDMYWINQEKEIVHIEHSVVPSSYPKSYRSPKPAQYILETNAGFAKQHNIQVGDPVSF